MTKEISISKDNPWVSEVQTRSKYVEECKLLHEILCKGEFKTSKELNKMAGISQNAFNYAMYQYYQKGVKGWVGQHRRRGREVEVRLVRDNNIVI